MHLYYVSRITGAICVAVLLAAAWHSIRVARADAEFRRGSPDAVARAVDLAPGNTEYLAFRALQIDYDGGNATPLLERAAELNRLSSAPRIRLGLDAEQRGDFAAAEKWLLEAARIDRQFEPRWTLANFYFRRENAAEFWKWMRAALEISYGDRRPAFDLCWREASPLHAADAAEVLARAIPERREVVDAYLAFLIETHRAEAVAPVAMKLAGYHDAADRPVLLDAVDTLIENRDAAAAVELWRALGYAQPNSGFEMAGVGRGFDWRLAEVTGVVHTAIDQPRAMHRITFDGREPEACELAREILYLRPHGTYTLTWQARTAGLAAPTGIEWRIAGQRGAVNAAGELRFTVASELVPLVLYYERPAGQARAEGSIELWDVTMH